MVLLPLSQQNLFGYGVFSSPALSMPDKLSCWQYQPLAISVFRSITGSIVQLSCTAPARPCARCIPYVLYIAAPAHPCARGIPYVLYIKKSAPGEPIKCLGMTAASATRPGNATH